MRGVNLYGPFSGIHCQKSKLDYTDERCKGRWAFFQGYSVRKSKLDDTDESVRVDGSLSGIQCQKIKTG
jgi:hypothetical protein